GDWSFSEILDCFGEVPIPPYMNRESEISDKERYQTIYAAKEGSVAAPTAGLHFTAEVLKDLRKKSIAELNVTLHVGAGTFKPVKSGTMQGHEMHSEWIEVNKETIEKLKEGNRKIIAVGTTSLRTIESLYWMGLKALKAPGADIKELEIRQWDAYKYEADGVSTAESLQALCAWMSERKLKALVCNTQILIAPPYKLKVADGLITNFHQPQSTLLLLVAAILGDKWREVYDYALAHDFRFLSYGDSSLLLK
ncbi:MAG: S-adenosylmethionine:tRNA ribosyltransferase-isomerase, partial [Bacteroidia bacterium]|nr:S-adenosylmethionine:tRNA ribosyltransferase-isomerase [Bacteroidia bacterium]